MANAEMIERLQWELESLESELRLAKAAIAIAAEQLQYRAERAIEQSKCLVEGSISSVSWIDFAQSDIEEAKRMEARLVTLREKHKTVSRFLEYAQKLESTEEPANPAAAAVAKKSTKRAPADRVF